MSQFLYKAFQSNDMINPRRWRYYFFYEQNILSRVLGGNGILSLTCLNI